MWSDKRGPNVHSLTAFTIQHAFMDMVLNVTLHSRFSWYHGNLSNSESEAMLKGRPNGTYLVRNSDKNSGQFTLCLRYDRLIADSAKTANTAHNTIYRDTELKLFSMNIFKKNYNKQYKLRMYRLCIV